MGYVSLRERRSCLLPGGAAAEVEEVRVAEAAVQAEEAGGGRLLPHGSAL